MKIAHLRVIKNVLLTKNFVATFYNISRFYDTLVSNLIHLTDCNYNIPNGDFEIFTVNEGWQVHFLHILHLNTINIVCRISNLFT